MSAESFSKCEGKCTLVRKLNEIALACAMHQHALQTNTTAPEQLTPINAPAASEANHIITLYMKGKVSGSELRKALGLKRRSWNKNVRLTNNMRGPIYPDLVPSSPTTATELAQKLVQSETALLAVGYLRECLLETLCEGPASDVDRADSSGNCVQSDVAAAYEKAEAAGLFDPFDE